MITKEILLQALEDAGTYRLNKSEKAPTAGLRMESVKRQRSYQLAIYELQHMKGEEIRCVTHSEI